MSTKIREPKFITIDEYCVNVDNINYIKFNRGSTPYYENTVILHMKNGECLEIRMKCGGTQSILDKLNKYTIDD